MTSPQDVATLLVGVPGSLGGVRGGVSGGSPCGTVSTYSVAVFSITPPAGTETTLAVKTTSTVAFGLVLRKARPALVKPSETVCPGVIE